MKEREQFIAWITKYAFTEGIQRKHVELCRDINPEMVSVIGGRNECYHGVDWHRDEVSAICRAKKMQAARIGSLEIQIKRIAALSFEPTK